MSYYGSHYPAPTGFAPGPGYIPGGSSSVVRTVPHTSYGYQTVTEAHTNYVPAVVGQTPVVHTDVRRVGIGHKGGKVHKAPWHKKYNVNSYSSHVDLEDVVVPVATTSYDTRVVPVAETHVDRVVETTTEWRPAAPPVYTTTRTLYN